MKTLRFNLTFLFVIFISFTSFAQQWEYIYDSPDAFIQTRDVVELDNGNIASVGTRGNLINTSIDGFVTTVDENGALVFIEFFDLLMLAVVPTTDGMIAIGQTNTGDPETLHLIRLDHEGQIIWQSTFGQIDIGMSSTTSATVLPDGAVIVASPININPNGFEFQTRLTKITADGNLDWTQNIPLETSNSISYLNTGHLAVCGATGGKATVQKVNLVGELIWTKTFYENDFIPEGVREAIGTLDNNIYVIGNRGGSLADIFLNKLNNDGDLLWERFYSTTTSNQIDVDDIIEEWDGNIRMVGSMVVDSISKIVLLNTDSDGSNPSFNILEQLTTKSSGKAIDRLQSGGYVVAGQTNFPQFDLYIAKFDGVVNTEELPSTFSKFQIFPNPVSDLLEIQFNLEENTEIQFELVNNLGQNISINNRTSSYPSGEHRLNFDISHLTNGIYHLIIKTNNHQFSKKIIKVGK